VVASATGKDDKDVGVLALALRKLAKVRRKSTKCVSEPDYSLDGTMAQNAHSSLTQIATPGNVRNAHKE